MEDEIALTRWSIPKIALTILLVFAASGFVMLWLFAGAPALQADEVNPATLGPAFVALLRAALVAEIATLVVLGVIVSIVEPRPWKLLGLEPVSISTFLTWSAAALAFTMIFNGIVRPLGYESLDFRLSDALSSNESRMLLLATGALGVISSELYYRGFLFGALRSRGIGVVWCAFWATLLYAWGTSIGPERGGHAFGYQLVIGSLLAWARAHSGSVLPPLGMHAAATLLDTIEMLLASGGGT